MARRIWAAGMMLAMCGATVARAQGTDSAGGVQFHVEPVQVEANAGMVKLGEYWLGVEAIPARGAMRAQLNLPEDQGLVVDRVAPDSPAAKAGLQRYDVLVAADKKPLRKIQDLIDAVEAVKGGKLTLKVIRGGKEQELTATPVKRPDEARMEARKPGAGEGDSDAVSKWLNQVWPGMGERSPLRFHFVYPGTILPRGAAVQPPLPDNMTVTITKKGSKPADIVVQRGEQKWEATEDSLNKLPDDVRPHVERMLGRLPLGTMRVFEPGPEWPQPPEFNPRMAPHAPEGRLERRVEEMNRRLDQMRKSLDEMREKQGGPKAEKPKPEKPKPATGAESNGAKI